MIEWNDAELAYADELDRQCPECWGSGLVTIVVYDPGHPYGCREDVDDCPECGGRG